MTRKEFEASFQVSLRKSHEILVVKAKEYSRPDGDRLNQFHRAAAAQDINPVQALVGMMTKHYTSICDYAKNPYEYDEKKWDEKIVDLRNYTILLDALLKDMGVSCGQEENDFYVGMEGERCSKPNIEKK